MLNSERNALLDEIAQAINEYALGLVSAQEIAELVLRMKRRQDYFQCDCGIILERGDTDRLDYRPVWPQPGDVIIKSLGISGCAACDNSPYHAFGYIKAHPKPGGWVLQDVRRIIGHHPLARPGATREEYLRWRDGQVMRRPGG